MGRSKEKNANYLFQVTSGTDFYVVDINEKWTEAGKRRALEKIKKARPFARISLLRTTPLND